MGLLSSKRLSSLLLAGASTAVIAAAVAPSAASAACTTITGQGASLQASAQSLWITNAPAANCNGFITYNSSSSGTGLTAFGANGAGVTPSTDAYIGTDDPPNAGQITNLVNNSGSSVEVFPVAQAAVAVLANLPSGCTTANARLWADGTALRDAYEGTTPSFSSLFPGQVSGAACTTLVRPYARNTLSGTSFIFKGFLRNYGSVRDTTGSATWGSAAVQAVARNGGEISDIVNSTDAAIGYAVLADANGRGITGTPGTAGFWTDLRNNTSLSSTAGPQVVSGTTRTSNCSNASYAGIPATTTNADWSGVLAGAPSSTSTYPLCGLTYAVAYSADYGTLLARTGGVRFTTNTGDTVKQYFAYVTGGAGQTLVNRNNYYNLVVGSTLQSRAVTGASNIN